MGWGFVPADMINRWQKGRAEKRRRQIEHVRRNLERTKAALEYSRQQARERQKAGENLGSMESWVYHI